jgi:hypothetical protein
MSGSKSSIDKFSFCFVSGYPPPTGLDHQAYPEEAALLVPIVHRSILTESRLPHFRSLESNLPRWNPL